MKFFNKEKNEKIESAKPDCRELSDDDLDKITGGTEEYGTFIGGSQTSSHLVDWSQAGTVVTNIK